MEWPFHKPYYTFGDFDESNNHLIILETNLEIDDNHMGEIGHQLQSEIILPYLRRFL